VRLVQIIINSVPGHLQACIQSVRSWAHDNNVDYCPIHTSLSLPVQGDTFPARQRLSEELRTMELARSPRTLYVDWDIFLYPDFSISDLAAPAFCPPELIDCMLYNGDHPDIFRDMLSKLNASEIYDNRLAPAIREYTDNNQHQLFGGHYVHLCNCRFAKHLGDLYYS
jgi:hypothetical protein